MPLFLASIIRHLLTLAAGGLLAVGVSEGDATNLVHAAEPVVTGVVLYGVSQAWSLIDQKKKR
jgi:hypothetical protein